MRLAEDRLQQVRTTDSFGIEVRQMGDLAAVRKKQLWSNPAIKDSTRDFWEHIFRCICNSWKGFENLPIHEVTKNQCELWAGKYSRAVSASLFNHALTFMKQLFDVAIKLGVLDANPVSGVKRKKPVQKDLSSKLPSREMFAAWVAEIRKSPSRWGHSCGDLVEFLAYSGLRIGEAKWVQWKHCDFARGELVVSGNPEGGTKNRQSRRVPMIGDLRELLTRMKRGREDEPEDRRVLKVAVAYSAMRHAAERIGMDPISHHDLRHLFATMCIESGVDVPTVSRWLGHRDGGALAMRVYGHLRNEHSLREAQKVCFALKPTGSIPTEEPPPG